MRSRTKASGFFTQRILGGSHALLERCHAISQYVKSGSRKELALLGLCVFCYGVGRHHAVA
jgi:hypothetical protein